MNRYRLRLRVLRSLRGEGFTVKNGALVPPQSVAKSTIREMHRPAVNHAISVARGGLERHETSLLRNLASGVEVVPEDVSPQLVEVLPGTIDELLFRYAKLHWSIPVSRGYGRRLRYLVKDRSNNRLIGLFGLADPVFSIPGRDEWIGWDSRARGRLLPHVMDAFVLGAVPPYSQLLGGKLTAMLMASSEVRESFRQKYEGHISIIRGRTFDGRLALITTTSALGKSAIYDRIRYDGRLLFQPVGFTEGWGEFHFSDGVYADLLAYANRYCTPTYRSPDWSGNGFRNKREVVLKVLPKLGIPREWLCHGVRREIFVVPMAKNTREFLQGHRSRLHWHSQPAASLSEYFRQRWLIPRSTREQTWKSWNPEMWRLWPHKN
jgi:Domain of unknown function (DUF4338)